MAARKRLADWREIAHQMEADAPHSMWGRVLLKNSTRVSVPRKMKGKTVTDIRRDDLFALLERARKARGAGKSDGLKGLFGGGR